MVMSMRCKIKFTATAKSDLRDIAFYIAEQAKDREIAIRFVGELQERCRILEEYPESGSVPSDRVLMSSGYRFLVQGDYLIFYLYEKAENTVYIMAVFNARRDYTKVMKKFL